MKIKFLIDYTQKDDTETSFEKGIVYDLRDDAAEHFLSRKIAVVDDTPVKKAPAKKATGRAKKK